MMLIPVLACLATISTGRAHLTTDVNNEEQKSGKVGPTCSADSESSVEECLRPMLSYATSLQSSGLLPLEGMQIFNKLCEYFREFERCTNSLGCRSISMDAMDASYGYMCGEGFVLFSKHVDCFAEVEQLQKYLACKNEATSAVNELQFDATAPSGYFGKLCTVMQAYLSCSRPIINTRCGREAWDLVTRVTKDSLKVTMPQCDLKPHLEVTAADLVPDENARNQPEIRNNDEH